MLKSTACFLFIISFFVLFAPSTLSANTPIETQVVAVFATKKVGSFYKPWKSPNFRSVRGSGFFFEDPTSFPEQKGLILTNAHVASMSQSLEISNGREKRRYKVNTVGVFDIADIAVLQLPQEERKEYEERNGEIVPLRLGNSDVLRVGDKVLGWGYPLGGERISKSEQGEISRIEVRRYAYSHESWLMVQASLQQNPGNSGGPILKDNTVVGIAFQGVMASDRINYFIPINLVKHLLPVLNNQERIPRWRYFAQKMTPHLKKYYGLDSDQSGVLLNSFIPGGGPETFGLKKNDILLDMDSHEIDNYGDIFFSPLEQRIYFEEIINRKKTGDILTMSVLRDGKIIALKGRIPTGLPVLVPKVFTNANYFIYGGIGLVELTANAIVALGKSGTALREQYLQKLPEKPFEKIVIIAEIFPEYELMDTRAFLMERAEKIDGEDILNVEMLHNTISKMQSAGRKKALIQIGKNRQLPLDLEGAEKLDKRIQEKYGILYMKTPGGFK